MTSILASVKENCCRVFAIPNLTLSSNNENTEIKLLFSRHSIGNLFEKTGPSPYPNHCKYIMEGSKIYSLTIK